METHPSGLFLNLVLVEERIAGGLGLIRVEALSRQHLEGR